ncbi:MAG: carboxymuconolactone decarboxylase family protein [Acidobacteria bacterium]|nr:carboxymuconolactone decarboxylase family protein [Acidobacteriota bacterium]
MKTFVAAAILFSPLSAVAQPQIQITRNTPQQSAPAENFTGSVRIDSAFRGTSPSRVSGARVTFEPGARTAWHTHTLGQTLIVTAGTGLVQRWGDPVQEIRQGDIVWIPAGQKHWHGASPTSAMTHIAIAEQLDGKSTDWMEKVTDEQYPAIPATTQPTAAQRLMGDIAPKLADLTDSVLYGDVWQRPQLSPRDRSLATVAALIAMNRPDQLRSHLALARTNGLTEEQLVEAITHLAFYAGWPSAVTAVGVARDVFKNTPRNNNDAK